VAGGLGRGVRVGDVVVASELLQHDMDASPIFPRHEVPLTGLKRFIADAALSEALAQAVQHVIADPAPSFAVHGAALGIDACALHRGLVVSGDRFVSTAAESAALRAELPDALAVEMEGAALAQVCHAFGVPFAVLRTISDRADDSAHIDFTRFIDEVASRMSAAIVAAWADPRVC
jgi:adenosylhomocysteine nucleosidase